MMGSEERRFVLKFFPTPEMCLRMAGPLLQLTVSTQSSVAGHVLLVLGVYLMLLLPVLVRHLREHLKGLLAVAYERQEPHALLGLAGGRRGKLRRRLLRFLIRDDAQRGGSHVTGAVAG